MSLLLLIPLAIFTTCVSAQWPAKVRAPEVDQNCMECICQASTSCDETVKCHYDGANNYFCGPYVISWAYWFDGGKHGNRGQPGDFETCVTNKTCAEQTVRGYMRRYGRDCDGSGTIDCADFARIHKLGFGQCSSNSILDTPYWENFELCNMENQNDDFLDIDARSRGRFSNSIER
ncbi:uncharacterized protein TNCV_4426501 [Trichonephila clavipes]|nr:uncharacterized protein TNCV_4426501 [Trichonephila clavipes]